jgi:hypothetical protein
VAESTAPDPASAGEIRDELPEDLNAVEHVGVYEFPDNSRRRRPAVMYALVAAACAAAWLAGRDGGSRVNSGIAWAAALFAALAVLGWTSGWRMRVDEKQALVAAQRAVGFAVGHASAQQVWRGLRSRPTWRVLVYSAESPPQQRGLVLVDAVDGSVIEHLAQDNPQEDWDVADA